VHVTAQPNPVQLRLDDALVQPIRGSASKAPRAPRRSGGLALSVEEAAQELGVARSTFYLSVLPELRVVRIGRRVLVPRRELERWLERSAAILPRQA
jgi:excisionase family DNA binding protein